MIGRTSYVVTVLALAIGCGGKARGPDTYRADTQSLLSLRSAQLKTCYDAALASDATLAGTVRVNFVVAKKTGMLTKATIDPASTAPEPLGRCVLQALDGLKLDPPDRNEGRATFEYAFQAQAASTGS
jgi:hypothetical protein